MANFGSAFFSAFLNNSQLIGAAAVARGALGSIGLGATKVGGAITTGITIPIIALGVTAVQRSREIEDAWNEVRATYNATPAEIEKIIRPHGELGKAVTDLSLKYGLNREEVIKLLGSLSQMGFTGKKATDTLRQGLEFAVALGLPLEKGLSTAVAIVSTFGLEGQKLTEVLRGLNSVENATAAGGADLEFGLRRAGGAALGLITPGLDAAGAIASIAGGMAVFKKAGQETSRSANALRRIFTVLYNPTAKVQGLWDKMGVSLTTANGNIKPFPQLLGEVGANFDKLNATDQMAFLKGAVGVEFGGLFRLLIEDQKKAATGQSEFNNALKQFGDVAQGSANYQRELDVRANSLSATLGKVGAAFDLVIDTIRPLVGQMIKPLADGITSLLTKFAEASPKTQQWTIAIIALLAILGPIVLMIGLLVVAISAISGPILLGVAAVVGLIAVFAALYNSSSTLGNIVRTVFQGIAHHLSFAWDQIKAGVQAILPNLKVLAVILGGVLLIAIATITAAIVTLAVIFRAIAEVVKFVTNIIVAAFKWCYNMLVGGSIIPDMVNGIKYWLGLIPAFVMAIINVVKAVFVAGWNLIKTVVLAVVAAIVAVVRTGLSVISAVISAVISVARAVWTAGWNAIRAVVTVVWAGIRAVVTAGINLVRSAISAGISVVRALWTAGWNAIRTAASTAWSLIRSVVSAGISFVRSLISSGVSAFRAVWTAGWNAIRSVTSSVISGIRSLVSSFINGVKSLISSGMNAAKSAWSSAWNGFKSVVSGVASSIKGIISGIVSAVTGMVSKVGGALSGAVSKAQGAASKIKSLVPGLSKGGLVPGSGNRDTFLARLTPGEFVLTKKAVKRIGIARLAYWNRAGGGEQDLVDAVKPHLKPVDTAVPEPVMLPAPGDIRQKVGAEPPALDLRAMKSIVMAAVPEGPKMVNQSVTFNTNVYNPVAEKASDSVQRRLSRVAQLGLFKGGDKL